MTKGGGGGVERVFRRSRVFADRERMRNVTRVGRRNASRLGWGGIGLDSCESSVWGRS